MTGRTAGEELIRIRVRDDSDIFVMRKLGREAAEAVGLTPRTRSGWPPR